MPKIFCINQNSEVVFSLPKGSVLENKNIIRMFSQFVGVNVNDSDLQKGVDFSVRSDIDMDAVVFILNGNGLSFLPDKIFMNEVPNAPVVGI